MFVTAEIGESNAYNFLAFHFSSAGVPSILSLGRLSVSTPYKLGPTGPEVISFECGLFGPA